MIPNLYQPDLSGVTIGQWAEMNQAYDVELAVWDGRIKDRPILTKAYESAFSAQSAKAMGKQ